MAPIRGVRATGGQAPARARPTVMIGADWLSAVAPLYWNETLVLSRPSIPALTRAVPSADAASCALTCAPTLLASATIAFSAR